MSSSEPWVRPSTNGVVGPNRNFGGIYRTAEVAGKGATLGGIPMQTASDAVVATVRLGYKVADRQIERGRRITKGLRAAGRRAGVDATQAVDSTERLLMRALLLGLDWVEGAASGGPEHPLRRLLAAEYGALGSMLGLSIPEQPAKRRRRPAPGEAVEDAAAVAATTPSTSAPDFAARAAASVVIRHAGKSARRPVEVLRYQLVSAEADERFPTIAFYPAQGVGGVTWQGDFALVGGRPELTVHTAADLAPGVWRAAVCRPDGVQIGRLDVEL